VIKGTWRAGPAGQRVLFLGLSGDNVTELAAGNPILITPAQLAALGLPPGLPPITIGYGRTNEDILDELASHGVELYQGG
jgi:hypothetical protein